MIRRDSLEYLKADYRDIMGLIVNTPGGLLNKWAGTSLAQSPLKLVKNGPQCKRYKLAFVAMFNEHKTYGSLKVHIWQMHC